MSNLTIYLSLLATIIFMPVLAHANEFISEAVYVESPTDTDFDGELDRIYVSVSRPSVSHKLSTIFKISPYATGGNSDVVFHSTDVDSLPQDSAKSLNNRHTYTRAVYAKISAHSLGTGRSTGCPTVGDKHEVMAAKAVVDWLNGTAKAFDKNNKPVMATWANGKVGMMGVSYNGTLPTMLATTGVKGLKAIVPIAAISSWYDYYRANGLVVNPGGYEGEDADILGKYIVRKGTCKKELANMFNIMGRKTGDYTPFWQARDYLGSASNIKAATFIIHGQSDWNVKQKHATQLWTALKGVAPRKMFLHRGGHGSTQSHGVPSKINRWFDHFLEGIDTGILNESKVEVELRNGELIKQNDWPHEGAKTQRLYFNSSKKLASKSENFHQEITDIGAKVKMKSLIKTASKYDENRLIFTGEKLQKDLMVTGSFKVAFNISVLNKRAANLSVVIVEYGGMFSSPKIITRGWMDPQNYKDISQGELLDKSQSYRVKFSLGPKQYKIAKGKKLGVIITATDYNYTLRPKVGTKLKFEFDSKSYIEFKGI